MSMSDPLLKELKACTFKLIQEIEKNSVITDVCEDLSSLCNILEGIFQKGFFGVCWDWLEQLNNDMEAGTIPKSFSYMRAVDTSKTCQKIKTNSGRLRLLIRCCLVNKCLHVPVELVVRVYRNHGDQWYDTKCSILGDEILGEIFLSVVLQLSTLHFKLDVTNARFLDNTFVLPHTVLVEFVPCSSLGVAVTFVEDKALVVQVDEKSVAAEDNKIQVGDILDEINNQVLKTELKGKLNSIISKSKSKPITVRLIKLFHGNEDTIYSPLIPLLRKANLDIYDVKRQIFGEQIETDASVVHRGGPKIKFVASVAIGSEGDVKQIEYAVASILSNTKMVEPMTVYIECQELGLKVILESTGKILFHHSYMEISSCGQTRKHPNYFAYVAGHIEKMGRKIPGKKHRTVKDPYKQKQRRINSLRAKVNNPPSNENSQEIPKSLYKIMELKAKTKEIKPQKRIKRNKGQILLSVAKLLDKEPFQKGMTKPDKFIPNLTQKPQESATHFLKRISLMTQNLINEVEFEKKFDVEIKKNPDTGQVMEVKHLKKQKIRSKKKKLSEKRKEKLELKREILKNIKDFSQLRDKIEFGEIVHRPPSFPPVRKKKSGSIENKEIVRYSNLLLNNVVEHKGSKRTTVVHKLEKEKSEKEQKSIVEAYRKLKKKKS